LIEPGDLMLRIAFSAKSGGLKMTRGCLEDLKAVMDLFDRFDPSRNYTIPMIDPDF